jgi:hypothetical protein
MLRSLQGITFDAAGNLYLGEAWRIRKVEAGADGVVTGAGDEFITTVAGGGNLNLSNLPALATDLRLQGNRGLAVDSAGNLFISVGRVVLRVDAGDGIAAIAAGLRTPSPSDPLGDGGPAIDAVFSQLWPLAFDAAGNLYVGDVGLRRVRRIVPGADGLITGEPDEIITAVAGAGEAFFSEIGGPATGAGLSFPSDVAFDAPGNLFVSSPGLFGDGRVVRVEPGADGVVTGAGDEVITVVAGGGDLVGLGDGEPATEIFLRVEGLAFDIAGNLFVTDGFRIRRISAGADPLITGAADEIISTVTARNSGFTGDGGPSTQAKLNGPRGLAFDAAGNLFVVDRQNERVRRIDKGSDGLITGANDDIITTVAGGGPGPSPGDGGPATSAFLGRSIYYIAFDAAGDLYIAGSSPTPSVRRVEAGADGLITGMPDEIITTVAGGGASQGDGGPATDALLSSPLGIAFDGGGNLFVSVRNTVRRVDAGSDGTVRGSGDEIITTIAGTPNVNAFFGDGGPATSAAMSGLGDGTNRGLVFDEAGNLFVADSSNLRVRRISEAGVPFNEPPTAVAGSDQPIHAGDPVFLDGSASFDDNTTTANLLFAWSFIERPVGSSASLTGAGTANPSFDADLPGTYRLQLVVTDEDGLSSDPDEIVISSTNLAPTADAGDDAGGVVGFISDLDGSGSSDPEDDPLAFSWSFVQTPTGSTAMLTGAGTDVPFFVPDLPGVYVVELVVSDPFDDSAPDTITITVITGEDFAENTLLDCVLGLVANLPPDHVTTKGNQRALTNFILQAIAAIQEGDIERALRRIDHALIRVDGCVLRGEPDGNGPGRDWITDYVDQVAVYTCLILAKDALSL